MVAASAGFCVVGCGARIPVGSSVFCSFADEFSLFFFHGRIPGCLLADLMLQLGFIEQVLSQTIRDKPHT
jgi:hypothetical protein